MSLTRPSTSVLRILLVVATVAAAAFTTAGSASAAIETAGSGTIAIGTGKTGKALGKAKIKVAAVEPATSSRNSSRAGAVTRVVAPASSVAVGRTSTVGLRGGIAFKRGKAKASFSKLNVKISSKRATVTALLAGKRINLFTGPAKALIDTVERRIRLSGAKVSLTAAAATALRTRLKVRRLFAGPVGTLSVSLRWTEIVPLVDPYFEQCGIAASSKLIGSLPAPVPLPNLTGAKTTVGAGVNWGFRSSFRGYIFGAGGSMQALDGAEVVQAGPFPSSFTWPNAPGSYAANDPVDMSDDQAIINSTGSVLFCNSPHNFRVVISNPTVVIDGDQGRIIADVDANFINKWIPSQRIDLATLDLTGITPSYNRSGAEVIWSDVPVNLTQSGADAICGTGDAPLCDYGAGDVLDEITVESKTAYDTSDFAALADYVDANLQFPLTDVSQGGCPLPNPVDGNKTIDQAFAANPATAPSWLSGPGNALPIAPIAAPTEATGGGVDWGLRSALRNSINGTGTYNLAFGASASHPYVGNGPGSSSLPADRQMNGDPGRFFTWPSSAGTVSLNGPGTSDDRLVLRSAGRVAFCQSSPATGTYGIVISSPEIEINGSNSRLVADVAVRYRLSWVRARVTLVSLDLAGAAYSSSSNEGITTASWTFDNLGDVKLTADGAKILGILKFGPNPTYSEGTNLDTLTVRASFPEA